MTTYDEALALDAADPLASFRDRFLMYDDPVAYLDGNSLGRPPKSTLARINDVLTQEWAGSLIRSWSDGWTELPTEVGDRLGEVLLGAAAGQTVIADSTTVNLFKLLHAACALRPDRTEIVIDDTNFPTDRYLAESIAAQRGMSVRWISPELTTSVTPELLASVLSDQTAVVLINQVDYRSGAMVDVNALTAQIHEVGALVIWDLCHSVGVVPLNLDRDEVDFAVGCTYKYVNGGPGAPAFMYVAKRHLAAVEQPITGWWSAQDMFAMAETYTSATSIRKMLSGTANVLGIVAVDEGVKLIAEAGLEAIRAKSIALTEFTIRLVDEWHVPLEVVTPRDAAKRGSHVTIRVPHARRITDDLIARGLIPDFRNPDMIRFGLSPLTTSFAEVWKTYDLARGMTFEQ
ncbi:aminotransferase class V-fold PLP-dependent enzyme [soil metagenome]